MRLAPAFFVVFILDMRCDEMLGNRRASYTTKRYANECKKATDLSVNCKCQKNSSRIWHKLDIIKASFVADFSSSSIEEREKRKKRRNNKLKKEKIRINTPENTSSGASVDAVGVSECRPSNKFSNFVIVSCLQTINYELNCHSHIAFANVHCTGTV